MIEVRGLTKRYGAKIAVDDLTFGIEPGKVTGFLGPNGAGKTTTMRCILGLDYADKGTVTVDGKVYPDLAYPMREVGALLDAKAVHGGRSAYNHLLCLAQTNNLPRRRVDEVLELVGLSEVARKRSKGFSLGMSQRLGIAATMLGDPKVLMFDEPVNGLDPEGILWIRNLMKALASEGRTVFVSSHLMSEMEYTADHLIVIGRGKLIADCSMSEFISRSSGASVRVRTPMADELIKAVTAKGAVAATGDEDVGRGPRPDRRRGRRHRVRAGHQAARAGHGARLARRGVHGADREQRRVPRRDAGRDHHHRKRCLSDGHRHHTERAAVVAAAGRRAGRPAGRDRLGVHQAPLGPLHLLDAGLAVRRLRRPRRRDLRGHGRQHGQQPGQQGRVRRDPDLAGRVLRARPADHRGHRGDGDHLGVLDRDDPHLADRAAPAGRGLRGQGDRVHGGDAGDLAHHRRSSRSSSARRCCRARASPLAVPRGHDPGQRERELPAAAPDPAATARLHRHWCDLLRHRRDPPRRPC